jgi:hypothetical protein
MLYTLHYKLIPNMLLPKAYNNVFQIIVPMDQELCSSQM